jgi:hypothetical protein
MARSVPARLMLNWTPIVYEAVSIDRLAGLAGWPNSVKIPPVAGENGMNGPKRAAP